MRKLLIGIIIALLFAATANTTLTDSRSNAAIEQSRQNRASRRAYYPPAGNEWARHDPEDAGMDSALLEEALSFAKASETKSFTNNPLENITKRAAQEQSGEIVGPTKERAPVNMIVLRDGYIVAEFGDTTRADMSFSVAKSFVSTTVGLAYDRKLIKDMNDPVAKYADDGGYQSAHNAKITWHQSLQQTSEWEGTLWGKPDTFDRRRGRNRKLEEPGAFWEYNDVRVNRTALSALRVWKRPLPEVLKQYIMDPIGASRDWVWHGYLNSDVFMDGRVMKSVSGGGHWGGGIWLSTRDLARFGLLFLRGGKWNGKQLISEQWIKMATTPCELRPDYGYMWWLNTNQTRYPGVPASAFAALGAGTNICLVDPENKLVIVARWIEDRKVAELIKKVVASVRRD